MTKSSSPTLTQQPLERVDSWQMNLYNYIHSLMVADKQDRLVFAWNPDATPAAEGEVVLSCASFVGNVLDCVTGVNCYNLVMGATREDRAALGTRPEDVYARMRKQGFRDLESVMRHFCPEREASYAHFGDIAVFPADTGLVDGAPDLKAVGVVNTDNSILCVGTNGALQRWPLDTAICILAVGYLTQGIMGVDAGGDE